MTGFTKGPWVLEEVDKYGDWRITVNGEPFMAQTSYYPYQSDNVYDAYLISAAPELYEALDDLINWFQSEYGESERLKAGLSALEKARGSQP